MTVEVPMEVRVAFAHAVLQSVADEVGIDVLHVKGPAVHVELLQRATDGSPLPRASTDADVLVRPRHAERFLAALRAHGWQQQSRFATGSPFEHAANLWSDAVGHADVHRKFPGIGIRPDRAFDALWERRVTIEIAHRTCATPDLTDQRLLLLLHAARAAGESRDKVRVWDEATDDQRATVRARAAELDAVVALAAALGELDQHRDDPAYDLWDQFSHADDRTRTAEWHARVRAARTPLQKASLMMRALVVNTDRLGMDLGHPPTRREVAAAQVDRVRRAVLELAARRRGDGA